MPKESEKLAENRIANCWTIFDTAPTASRGFAINAVSLNLQLYVPIYSRLHDREKARCVKGMDEEKHQPAQGPDVYKQKTIGTG